MITQEFLKNFLNYDQQTGVFTYAIKTKGRFIGDIAGSVLKVNDSVRIKIKGVTHSAQSLAWLYVHGEYIKDIYHVDGNRRNNKIDNLRKPVDSSEITQEYLKQNINYNPETGHIVFIKKGPGRQLNKHLGSFNTNGHLIVRLLGKTYLVHRLIWLYVYGYIPNQIDHINHIKTDNRLCNLREVSGNENNKNCPIRKDNKSGFNGVNWHKGHGKWQVSLRDKNQIHIGYFANIEDAIEARKKANIAHGFHENHGAIS